MMTLIDKEKLIKLLRVADMFGHNENIPQYAWKIIHDMPEHSATWINTDAKFEGFPLARCSSCNFETIFAEFERCPRCGAKMENHDIY